MNNTRRNALRKIADQLEVLKSGLEDIMADEEEYRDNIPENLQSSERYAKIAADRADIIVVSREDIIAGLELFRDGNVKDKKYQAKLFDTFLVSVYVYDDDLKIVFSFTGGKNTVRIPLDPSIVENFESEADSKSSFKHPAGSPITEIFN